MRINYLQYIKKCYNKIGDKKVEGISDIVNMISDIVNIKKLNNDDVFSLIEVMKNKSSHQVRPAGN